MFLCPGGERNRSCDGGGQGTAYLIAHLLEVWESALANGSLITAGGSFQRGRRGAIRAIIGGQVVPMLAQVVPPGNCRCVPASGQRRSWGWRSPATS